MSSVTDRRLLLSTLAIKHPVRVATTANIELDGLQTIDGITVAAGDRVLVKDQDDASENGIYRAASGTWDRDQDFNDNADVVQGTRVYVVLGTVGAGREYQVSTASPNIGSAALAFAASGAAVAADAAADSAADAASAATIAASAASAAVDGLEAIGGTLQQAASRRVGTLVTLGDSNYSGRIAFYNAIGYEWRHDDAPFALWTHYNIGISGYQVAGLVNSISTGAQDAPPVDYPPTADPQWDSNVWRVVNAEPDVVIMSLGINDLNNVANRASVGVPATFNSNFDTAVGFLLQNCPNAAILLMVPAPYVGENFVTGPFNTDWAADAPLSEPTIDGNAAYCSAIIRAAYLRWRNVHPRITVWDSAEVFGTRIDDKTVDGQDPEGEGALMSDSLHFNDLGGRRIVQSLSKMLGFAPKRATTLTEISTLAMQDDVFWGRWYFTEALEDSGSDTLVSIRPSSEHLFIRGPVHYRSTASLSVPQHKIYDAELAHYLSTHGIVRELLALTGGIKIYFPASGNTYSPTQITLSQSVTNSDGTRLFVIKFWGVNMGSETDIGLMYVYVNREECFPFLRRNVTFAIDNAGGGGVFNPQRILWYPSTYTFARGVGTNAIDVKLYAWNQVDGRMIEAGLAGTPYSAPGAVVAEGSLGSGEYESTLTLNSTNWPSGFPFKSNYRLAGRVTSGTLVGTGSFAICG